MVGAGHRFAQRGSSESRRRLGNENCVAGQSLSFTSASYFVPVQCVWGRYRLRYVAASRGCLRFPGWRTAARTITVRQNGECRQRISGKRITWRVYSTFIARSSTAAGRSLIDTAPLILP